MGGAPGAPQIQVIAPKCPDKPFSLQEFLGLSASVPQKVGLLGIIQEMRICFTKLG